MGRAHALREEASGLQEATQYYTLLSLDSEETGQTAASKWRGQGRHCGKPNHCSVSRQSQALVVFEKREKTTTRSSGNPTIAQSVECTYRRHVESQTDSIVTLVTKPLTCFSYSHIPEKIHRRGRISQKGEVRSPSLFPSCLQPNQLQVVTISKSPYHGKGFVVRTVPAVSWQHELITREDVGFRVFWAQRLPWPEMGRS